MVLVGVAVYVLTVLHLKKRIDLFKICKPKPPTEFEISVTVEKEDVRKALEESIASSAVKRKNNLKVIH